MSKPEKPQQDDVLKDHTVADKDSVAEPDAPRGGIQNPKPPMAEPQPERVPKGGGTKR